MIVCSRRETAVRQMAFYRIGVGSAKSERVSVRRIGTYNRSEELFCLVFVAESGGLFPQRKTPRPDFLTGYGGAGFCRR